MTIPQLEVFLLLLFEPNVASNPHLSARREDAPLYGELPLQGPSEKTVRRDVHNTFPQTQVDCCNTRDGHAHFLEGVQLCVWSSQPGPLWTCLVSHETPEVTSVAHAPTGNFHPFPPPFQHDILILMCSRCVSCWEGERKCEEASTWARFLGNSPGRSPSRHPIQSINCSLIFAHHRALSIKKKWVH